MKIHHFNGIYQESWGFSWAMLVSGRVMRWYAGIQMVCIMYNIYIYIPPPSRGGDVINGICWSCPFTGPPPCTKNDMMWHDVTCKTDQNMGRYGSCIPPSMVIRNPLHGSSQRLFFDILCLVLDFQGIYIYTYTYILLVYSKLRSPFLPIMADAGVALILRTSESLHYLSWFCCA